jgi:hypothetical protein
VKDTLVNPRIGELIEYLDRERADLDRAIATVPANRHTTRPSAEAWSVAEVVNHIALTDGRITALLTKITGEARGLGASPDTETSPLLPKIKVSHVLDRTKKIRNPRGDPAPDCNVEGGLSALDAARKNLKALLHQPDLPSLGGVAAPHPAFGPMTGYEWVAFMAAHTRRHADQIREIGGQLRP